MFDHVLVCEICEMSNLIKTVIEAVRPHLYSEGGDSETVAVAAIQAVASWIENNCDENSVHASYILRVRLGVER
jgi:hypothetical protein